MKIFAIVDFHGATQVLDSLVQKIRELQPDVICYSGDVVKGHKRGDEWLSAKREGRAPERTGDIEKELVDDEAYLRTFYGALDKIGVPVVAIPGNMDAPKTRFLEIMGDITKQNRNIHLVHGKPFSHADVHYIGYGGEINEPEEDYFVQITSPSTVRSELEDKLSDLMGKKFVLLTHHPPRAEKVDTDDGVTHRGSDFVSDLIQIYKPVVAICGHIHKAKAEERLGITTVVNPGALKSGNAALIELNDEVKIRFLTI